jgi:predicted amidohydrolase YtcJ/mono/diheme cytochrome c family protein
VQLGSPAARYSLADIAAVVAVHTSEVQCDPLFKRALGFTGFRLSDVLKTFFKTEAGDTLVFTAADGYQSLLPLNAASDPRALLAFSNAADGASWLSAQDGGTAVDPAPLYLVWEGASACDPNLHLPWPYQVISISVAPRRALLTAIEPDPDTAPATVLEGFETFQTHCLSCHRIRDVGGDVGPALVAVNGALTDYLPAATLRAYVLDAPSINPSTKMPPFKDQIDAGTFENLIAYIHWAGSNTDASNASRRADTCPGGQDWLLTNGKILTMAPRNRTASSVRIRGRRIIGVGDAVAPGVDSNAAPDAASDADPNAAPDPASDADPNAAPHEACVRIIDLDGRTVIPGLIDSHTHFVRTAQAPGPFIEGLESADSIGALQAALAAAAKKAEPGEWIAAIGGFTPMQFAERRMPTRAELSAAVSDHPVYLQIGYLSAGLTNDAGSRALEAAGIAVDDAGVTSNDGAALTFVLRSRTDERMKRRFKDYIAYAASLGLTTVVDQACCDFLGAHLTAAERPNMRIAESLWRGGEIPLRLRFQYDHRDVRDQNDIHSLTARLANATFGLGDDMYKAVRVGEQVIAAGATDEEVFDVYERAAEAGWPLSQHTIRHDEIERYLRIMERVAAKTPVSSLRWTLEHVFEITPDQIERLKAIGVSVRVQDQDYLRNGSFNWKPGPPFRTLLESGIRMGAGTDSGVVGPLNPWLSIYYMVTGKDAGGEIIIPGEQIGRMDALRLYTAANAWYTHEEDMLGSIEAGKLADLVVLDRPYLEIGDEEIKRIRPVLTMIGGRIVHAGTPYETFSGLSSSGD